MTTSPSLAKAGREHRVPIMLTTAELAAIDEFRFAAHIPTRSGAIRMLCKMALSATTKTEAGK